MRSSMARSPKTAGISLTTRVALASALAASLGGAVAAVASGLTARELIHRHQDQTLLKATEDLASEMREEFEEEDEAEAELEYGPGGRTWQAVLLHELEDVKLPDARAALSQAGRFLTGDPTLARPAAGECLRTMEGTQPGHVCSVRSGEYLVTLGASEERERQQLGLFGRAVLFGALVGAILGWLLSRRVADWVLAPLYELRDRVREVHVDRLGGADPAASLALSKSSPGEVEELRQAIAQLVARLAQALGQARAFAAEAAHELRTPLTTIAGELELLSEQDDLSSSSLARSRAHFDHGRAQLERVRGQVADLASLVERLLVLTRTGDDAKLAHTETLDWSDLVELALGSLPPTRRERVQHEVEDDVMVRGDSTLLRALLSNGLDNALKFSSGPVRLKVYAQAGEARVEIMDTGSGIPATERQRVFAPFFRSGSARAAGTAGHGMGLALIAAVAQAHRGTAEFLPAEHGAHLCVRMPLWTQEAN